VGNRAEGEYGLVPHRFLTNLVLISNPYVRHWSPSNLEDEKRSRRPELLKGRTRTLREVLGKRTWNSNRNSGGKGEMNETLWRCDQIRAGQLYNRMMFDTREEAEQFMNRMRQMEPDQMISIEPVDASKVWN
jgi:hypothetical protein